MNKINWFKNSLLLPGMVGCAILSIGCTNFSSHNSSVVSSSSSSVGQSGSSEYKYSCQNPAERGSTAATWRRLTKTELINTYRDLFGDKVYAVIATQLGSLPDENISTSPNDFKTLFSSSHSNILLQVALSAARTVAANTQVGSTVSGVLPLAGGGSIKEISGGCTASTPPTETCVRTVIKRLGSAILRRPLVIAEEDSYFLNYKAEATPEEGFALLMARQLMSPQFLTHVENGVTAQSNGIRRPLTQYEIANRLSYSLTEGPPDKTLLAAAAAGQLSDLQRTREQANRLIRSSRGKQRLLRLIEYWLGITQNTLIAPAALTRIGLSSSGAFEEMRTELDRFVEYIVFEKGGNLRDLLLNRSVFPHTSRLAKIYGVSLWAEGSVPQLNNSTGAGLLLRPAVLAGSSDLTKPITRGVNFRRQILCDSLTSPDPGIIATRDQAVATLTHTAYANREFVTIRTNSPVCMSCHQYINPIGFTLENIGPLGIKRNQEEVYENDVLVATHPIDTSVQDAKLEGSSVQSVSGPEQLVQSLVDGGKIYSCLARQTTEFVRLQLNAAADNCRLAELERGIKNPALGLLDALVNGFVSEDFLYRKDN